MNIPKALLAVFVFVVAFTQCAQLSAQPDRRRVPRVVYKAPNNDSVVDLTGKNTLTFEWKGQPTPGGGRQSYRFRLFKGFEYGAIVTKEVDRDAYSVDVPAEKFESGATYSWQVEQRDASIMAWSLPDRWSFKVMKK